MEEEEDDEAEDAWVEGPLDSQPQKDQMYSTSDSAMRGH